MSESEMLELALKCLQSVQAPKRETARFLRTLEACRREFYRIEDQVDAPLPHL